MKEHISSGAVVYIVKNGTIEFLVMYRKSSNSWHLPKGTRNASESLEETALREVKEETGLEMNIEKYIGKLDSTFERNGKMIQKETHYFLAQPKESGAQPDNHDQEHDEICFLEYRTALNHLQSFSPYEQEGEILKMAEQMLR